MKTTMMIRAGLVALLMLGTAAPAFASSNVVTHEVTQQQLDEAQDAMKNASSLVERVLAEQSFYDLQAKLEKGQKAKAARSVASAAKNRS